MSEERVGAAIAGWDNEGGAVLSDASVDTEVPQSAEIDQLRARVIALENLVLALLMDGSDELRNRARALAVYISPRPAAFPHPLTLRAATRMRHLIERADSCCQQE